MWEQYLLNYWFIKQNKPRSGYVADWFIIKESVGNGISNIITEDHPPGFIEKDPKTGKKNIKKEYINKSWSSENQGEGLDLIEKMLCYDPKKRITPEKALQHPWFKMSPYKEAPKELIRTSKKAKKGSSHTDLQKQQQQKLHQQKLQKKCSNTQSLHNRGDNNQRGFMNQRDGTTQRGVIGQNHQLNQQHHHYPHHHHHHHRNHHGSHHNVPHHYNNHNNNRRRTMGGGGGGRRINSEAASRGSGMFNNNKYKKKKKNFKTNKKTKIAPIINERAQFAQKARALYESSSSSSAISRINNNHQKRGFNKVNVKNNNNGSSLSGNPPNKKRRIN